MNISFSSKENDDCSQCLEYKNCSENCEMNCAICKSWKIHINNAKLARDKSRLYIKKQYQSYCKITNASKYLVISADMQKTLQIPVIKNNYFCEKLNVYNLTFAQLGVNEKSLCVISHEEQINKNSSDLVNYYLKFLFSNMCENFENLVIKCDNCVSAKVVAIHNFYVNNCE
jgi:hypothetical protein